MYEIFALLFKIVQRIQSTIKIYPKMDDFQIGTLRVLLNEHEIKNNPQRLSVDPRNCRGWVHNHRFDFLPRYFNLQ